MLWLFFEQKLSCWLCLKGFLLLRQSGSTVCEPPKPPSFPPFPMTFGSAAVDRLALDFIGATTYTQLPLIFFLSSCLGNNFLSPLPPPLLPGLDTRYFKSQWEFVFTCTGQGEKRGIPLVPAEHYLYDLEQHRTTVGRTWGLSLPVMVRACFHV